MADDRDYTVAQFINDAKSILREEGETPESMAHVGSNLQRLTQRKDLLEQGTEIPSGVAVRSRLLHLEPNKTLHLAVGLFRRDQPTIETTLIPNPPKDTDGRREDSGRGWVRELQGRWPGVLG